MSESSTVVGFRSTREVLCGLVRPLYLPSAVYSVGVGAAIPAQVTVGLDVGLTASVVALLVACSGAAMIAGTWWAGTVVERFGERSALAGATALAVLSVVGLGVTLWTTSGGAVVAYVVALFGFNLSARACSLCRAGSLSCSCPVPSGPRPSSSGSGEESGRGSSRRRVCSSHPRWGGRGSWGDGRHWRARVLSWVRSWSPLRVGGRWDPRWR